MRYNHLQDQGVISQKQRGAGNDVGIISCSLCILSVPFNWADKHDVCFFLCSCGVKRSDVCSGSYRGPDPICDLALS